MPISRASAVVFNAMAQPNDEFAGVVEEYLQSSGPAADQLIRQFYPQLRQMAKSRMRQEATEHSWQPTVLLNELYLELRKVKTLRPVMAGNEVERAAFLSFAAHLMKRLLIHHARPVAQRFDRVTLDSLDVMADVVDPYQEIETSLTRLSNIDPQLRRVVEMKFFEGLSEPDIAAKLNCSVRNVSRCWQFARQFLNRELA